MENLTQTLYKNIMKSMKDSLNESLQYDFMREMIIEAMNNDLSHVQGSETTQIATTTGSYRKAAKILSSKIPEGSKVLDYGAGLGKGTEAMREELPKNKVEDYEPGAKRGYNPHYRTAEEVPHEQHHGVVSLNVLNVLPQRSRDAVTRDILHKLSVGGHAIIGTRRWKGDVANTKTASAGEEPNSVVIPKKGGNVFQRGIEPDELHRYVQGHADSMEGKKFKVTRISGVGASGVHVERME